MIQNAKLAVVGLLLPVIPLVLLTFVMAVAVVVSLLPGAKLRAHVQALVPLLTAAICVLRSGSRPSALEVTPRS